jgi:hypothetical protein
MKNFLLIPVLALTFCAPKAHAQALSNYAYCKCIEDFSYEKHIDEYYKSDFKCFRAWKKDMKRKKKECQAKALEKDFPMAARRKKREAYRKTLKRDKILGEHHDYGKVHDYWY